MNTGYLYLLGYITFLGIGTFVQKFSMKHLSPYQLHFLISVGMLLTAIPILLFQQKNVSIPLKGLPLGIVVGILFPLGSLFFTLALSKMEVGLASALSITYVLITAILSMIFLKEPFTIMKGIGMALTLLGVAILYSQQSS